MIRQVNEEIQFSKREVQMLRQEKEQLENVLSHKSTEVRKNLPLFLVCKSILLMLQTSFNNQ